MKKYIYLTIFENEYILTLIYQSFDIYKIKARVFTKLWMDFSQNVKSCSQFHKNKILAKKCGQIPDLFL